MFYIYLYIYIYVCKSNEYLSNGSKKKNKELYNSTGWSWKFEQKQGIIQSSS